MTSCAPPSRTPSFSTRCGAGSAFAGRPREQFAPIQEKRNVSAYPERSVLKLHPQHLAHLQEPCRSFWTGVCDWLLGGHIATALLDKFSDQVRAFAFPKTASSFHGVEPITRTAVQRYLLLYDLRNPAVS